MKSGILWLMLAVSVLFNVFFVAGYVKARTEQSAQAVATGEGNSAGPMVEPREDRLLRMVAEELDLTDEQQQVFVQLSNDRREDELEFRASIEVLQHQLILELEKPQPDVDAMQRLAEQQGELRRRARQLEAGRFSKFVEVLTPEQREKLSSHMRRGPENGRRRGGADSFIRKFDKDGDGKLSDEEHAAAREWQQQREREWQQARDRFDVNGDGELDEQEQKALREWRRERDLERTRQRFDANNDGQLDDAEQAAMQQWLREQREQWNSRGRDRDGHDRGEPSTQRNPERSGGPPTPPQLSLR